MTAYDRLHDALESNGCRVKDGSGGKFQAQCPAHDDNSPSLSVKQIEGSVLLHCHAGCGTAQVLDSIGWTMADLYDNPAGTTYRYPGGREVTRRYQGGKRSFPQRGAKNDRSLFHADRLGDATDVLVVEGEKDVLAAELVGAVAVSSAMGAGKAYLADWTPLKGRNVTVVADDDDVGRKHAADVVDLVREAGAASVRVVKAAVGKDLADHIAADKGLDELVSIEAPPRMAAALLSRDALKRLPDPEPLIDDVLDRGTVALLYGKWASGKSFIAQDWAACVATGKGWQGRPVETARVLYVAAEGAFGMKGRLEAWEAGWHRRIPDDALVIYPRPVNLTNSADTRDLAELIEWGGFGFIVVDTLARCMVGADENSAKDCGEVVDALNRLRENTPNGRGVVLGVHHTGKDGKTFRGSSVFEAGADTVYAVNVNSNGIHLEREKRKDGPPTGLHHLQLDPIEGTSSCVISAGNLFTSGVDRSDRAARLLSTFVQHFVHTGASKSELRNLADMPSATFYRAINDLLESGDLVNAGTEKRPFYKAATK